MWLELAREGYEPLKRFATNSILPNILVHYNLTMVQEPVKRLIYWRFFDQTPETSSYLLNAMQRLISETRFEAPFLETIERLTGDKINELLVPSHEHVNIKRIVERRARKQFYVYSLHNSKSTDIRGAINYFGMLIMISLSPQCTCTIKLRIYYRWCRAHIRFVIHWAKLISTN